MGDFTTAGEVESVTFPTCFLIIMMGAGRISFCVAVNLLELSEIQEAIDQIQSNDELPSLPFKSQCLYVAEVFQKDCRQKKYKIETYQEK